MAEQKQPLVIALGRGHNGFYCPETRFHLIGVIKPQAVYTAAVLSEDVKRGLRGSTLVDVNGVLTEDDLKPTKGIIPNLTSADRKKAILIQADELAEKDRQNDIANGKEKDDYTVPNFSDKQGELLSEPDILSSTKKELLAFIEKTEDLELETLGLTSRSSADEVKDALVKHFGYNEKPVDVSKEAVKDEE